MQNLVLYNAPQSTCSQRVRFTLHEKGLAFSELKLDLFSGMPVLVRLADLGLGTLWEHLPTIDQWLAALRARPAFSKTYYFGSLLTEKYPDLKDNLVRQSGSGT
jgi:glutathione S-transferase